MLILASEERAGDVGGGSPTLQAARSTRCTTQLQTPPQLQPCHWTISTPRDLTAYLLLKLD